MAQANKEKLAISLPEIDLYSCEGFPEALEPGLHFLSLRVI